MEAPQRAAVLLLAGFALLSQATADPQVFTRQATYSGDGTYYGYRTRGFGHCSFHFHGFGDSPGYRGMPLAINAAQYTGTSICGLCVKFRGTTEGCTTCGHNPVSTQWQSGFICDQCPECKFGDLDQQKGGDGRWRIEWYPVQCPVGSSSFRFGFQGGNPWYRKMMVANARVPLADVKIREGGAWKQLTKTIDNYWEYHGDASKVWAPCARIQVTSILGDTVEDSVCCSSGTCWGKAQLPCRANLPSEDCSSVQQPGKINVGGIGQAASGPRPQQQQQQRTASEAAKASLSRGGDLSAARVAGARVLAKGQQCGGSGFDCGKAGAGQCGDRQFANTRCDAGLACVRNDAKWWGCK